jgi:hypothetical protein
MTDPLALIANDYDVSPYAHVPEHERVSLCMALLQTPQLRALLEQAEAEFRDGMELAAFIVRTVVDNACLCSPGGPFDVAPFVIDLVLMRAVIVDRVRFEQIGLAIDIALEAADAMNVLAAEHITLPPPELPLGLSRDFEPYADDDFLRGQLGCRMIVAWEATRDRLDGRRGEWELSRERRRRGRRHR